MSNETSTAAGGDAAVIPSGACTWHSNRYVPVPRYGRNVVVGWLVVVRSVYRAELGGRISSR
jgi:hypothetical protein